MTVTPHPFRRHIATHRAANLNLQSAFDALDNPNRSSGDFVHTHVPLPAFETTRIAALTHGRQTLLAIAVAHVLGPPQANDRLKVLLAPYGDDIGFVHYDIPMLGAPFTTLHHLPYDQARSTRFPLLQPTKWEWHDRPILDVNGKPVPERILLLHFNTKDLFQTRSTCGINIARTRDRSGEESSWNPATGNRFFDAATFGVLHHNSLPSACAATLTIQRASRALHVQANPPSPSFTLHLADPFDKRRQLKRPPGAAHWSLPLSFLQTPGRYRLYLTTNKTTAAWWFDSPATQKTADFTLGMFYDIPDDLQNITPFTPKSLRAHIQQLHTWGIRRIHWIDYAPPACAELLWRNIANLQTAQTSYQNCGDLLQSAARICRSLDIPCIGVLKPFEGLRNNIPFPPGATDTQTIDGSTFCLQPAVAGAQDAAIRAHPNWRKPATLPIRKISFISNTPLPKLTRKDFILWVSDDNRTFTRYRGPLTLQLSKETHSHIRWSPAGPVLDKGWQACHILHLENIRIPHRFFVLEWKRTDLRITNRAFTIVQAIDDAGHPAHITLARTGNTTAGLNFYSPRRAWSNHSEPIIDWLDLGPGQWGMMFAPLDRLPAILEPLDPRSRETWLDEVAGLILRGVTGVDIRLLCHHVDCQDWGSLTFSPAVLEAFQQATGRPPTPSEADLHLIRRLRGAGITTFLREARALTRTHGIKLITHLEGGIEVPPHLHTRNQLHLDWQTWMQEKLMDEVMLKHFSPRHPFVMEHILPLARRQGIPVHMCDLNNSLSTPRGIERAVHLSRDLRTAGLAGLCLYEANSYLRLNALSQPSPIGHAASAIQSAAASHQATSQEATP